METRVLTFEIMKILCGIAVCVEIGGKRNTFGESTIIISLSIDLIRYYKMDSF